MHRPPSTAKRLLFLLAALVLVLLPGRSSINRNPPHKTIAEPPVAAAELRRSRRAESHPTDRANHPCHGDPLIQPDLAGNCRAWPRATMGALEAVNK